MKKRLLYFVILFFIICLNSISLKEVYEQSQPQNGYDKYLELNTGEIYTGGLLIGKVIHPFSTELYGGEGENVKIVGNGAILDLQGNQISISMCNNVLDIEDCIIINGNIRYRGVNSSVGNFIPTGTVQYVTFYTPQDYGIRLQGAGNGINIHNNIVVNAIDTGYDYVFMTGESASSIPTGHNFSCSIQYGFYGIPEVSDNWSYRFHDQSGIDSLAHFSLL